MALILTEAARNDPEVAELLVASIPELDDDMPEVTAVPFPTTPKQAVFYGLAGDIVRAIDPHTEADPVALLAQILVSFGNCVGRNSYFEVEATRHYPNEFAALVGVTSKARKGTSWSIVRRLFALTDEEWEQERIQSGLTSGEGLIWAVRDEIRTVDKKGDEHIVPGVEDKRLLAYEAEFSMVLRVLARDGNTLSAVIRDAWDSGKLTTLTKNNPAKATGVHISIIGHITREELRRYIDATELANGFLNRFLLLAVKRSKLLPEGGNISSVDLQPLVRRLQVAMEFAKKERQLSRSSEARELWARIYPKLAEGQPGLFGAAIARAEAHVVRLSLLYALLDMSPTIEPQHLKAALALWAYAEDSARWIFGQALGDPVADEIMKALREHPEGLTRTDINRLFHSHKSGAEIASALGRLLEAGKVRRETEPGPGRPAGRWFYAEEKA